MVKQHRSGFSLVELAIAVSIIGILAALAIPLYNLIMVRSRISTLASDLRSHADAILRYTMEVGEYPDSFGSGSIPSELQGFLPNAWLESSAIGGEYSWHKDSAADGTDAYIQVSPTSESPFAVGYNDLLKLDEEIDDGSAGKGYLRISGSRVRYYVSQK